MSTITRSCRHVPSVHAGPYFSVQTGFSPASQRRSKRDTIHIEADVFRSLVNIDLFTRLQSLTLLDIDGASLCRFLLHTRRCSRTPLILRSQFKDPGQKREIVEHLSSIVGQLTLVRLEMLNSDLSVLLNQLEWPSQPKLQQLMVAWNSQSAISKILDHLPDLTTLVLNDESIARYLDSSVYEKCFSATHSRLTSLTISNMWGLLPSVRYLLRHTPSLAYLKITGARDPIINGFRWEELIKTDLPALNKFEFHQVYMKCLSSGESSVTLLNRVMTSFRSAFWTEAKRWLVIAHWHPVNQTVEIYTHLVCTPDYLPSWHLNTITMTNFDTRGQ